MKLRFLIAAAAALLLVGCAPPGTYSKIRNSIRTLAEKELGPADRYDVDTSHDNADKLLDGRISRVDVHGVNVRPAPGYVLDEVFVSARNVHVNRQKKTIESVESTSAKAYISNGSLAQMISTEGTLSDPTVAITPAAIRISGGYKVFGALPMDVVATGKARIVGTAGIEFTSDSVTAAGLPTPFSIKRLFDFSKLYPALVITGLSTEDGRAILTGTLDWSKLKHE